MKNLQNVICGIARQSEVVRNGGLKHTMSKW